MKLQDLAGADFSYAIYRYSQILKISQITFDLVYAATGQLFANLLGNYHATPPCLHMGQYLTMRYLGFMVHSVHKHHGVYNRQYFKTKILNNMALNRPVICMRAQTGWDLILNVDHDMRFFTFSYGEPIQFTGDWYEELTELLLLDPFYPMELELLNNSVWTQANCILLSNLYNADSKTGMTTQEFERNIYYLKKYIVSQNCMQPYKYLLNTLEQENEPLSIRVKTIPLLISTINSYLNTKRCNT